MERDDESLDSTQKRDPALVETGEAKTGVAQTVPSTDAGTGAAVHGASSGRAAPRARTPSSYQLGGVIGRGGMGEVLSARDQQLGRDVAIKRMLMAEPDDDAVGRFLREARIQARLDHPAVVPVHELGYDDQGRPYFTMKRLAGTTLHDVLERRSATLQRLLRAFVDVCLAIDLAHSRGIVHRDLKPANVMLGDYGEVYVLDWGIARLVGDVDRASQADIPSIDNETRAGDVLGTPGYMAPEQERGELVGPPADVYSLGCMLFEILANEPMHPRGKRPLDHAVRPSVRRPDLNIAPELDGDCAAATAAEPTDRPSARALADSIQRYLDGDRDLEQRRTLAAEHVERANELLAAGDRAAGTRAAGRALALDPESTAAGALVSSLFLEPPRVIPAELERHLLEVDRRQERHQYAIAQRWQLAFFPFLPFVMWLGVTSWLTVGVMYALIAMFVVVAQFQKRAERPHLLAGLALSVLPMFLFPRVFSPFVIAPGVLAVMMSSWAAYPSLLRRPWIPIVTLVAPIVVAVVLEATGVLSSTWSVHASSLEITSAVLEVHGVATSAFLIASTIAGLVVCGALVRQVALERHDAQRMVEIHAWHLRQLLPRT